VVFGDKVIICSSSSFSLR